MPAPPQVGFDDVLAAREVLRGVVTTTPMLHSWVLSDRLGGPVYLKCENLQRVIDAIVDVSGVLRASTVIALDTPVPYRVLPLVHAAARGTGSKSA